MFALFAGDHYYPGGGWTDHIGSYDTKELACIAANAGSYDWWHVIDLSIGREVVNNRDYCWTD